MFPLSVLSTMVVVADAEPARPLLKIAPPRSQVAFGRPFSLIVLRTMVRVAELPEVYTTELINRLFTSYIHENASSDLRSNVEIVAPVVGISLTCTP